MLVLKLALRTLLRRKSRMVLIGLLVAFGTFLIIFGTTFTSSAAQISRQSIIENFTGDFIIYSARSKEKPSPFAFQTPLPNIQNVPQIEKVLDGIPEVTAYAPYAQNFAVLQVMRNGTKVELPFIFYAIDPASYRAVFRNEKMTAGNFFGLDPATASGGSESSTGIVISNFQKSQYERNNGVTLSVGEPVTILGVTEGGVSAATSRLIGTFEPQYYKNVFNYINFVDFTTYSNLYSFTGVAALPQGIDESLSNAGQSDSGIFGLASNNSFNNLDLKSLKEQTLSGYTMIAVRLKDHSQAERIMKLVATHKDLNIKVAGWREASTYFAQIASGLQTFIYFATGLIFLIVAFIFMNTLIINITERTDEIGTMRAMGAEKSFVRMMFVAETLLLNTAASVVAMIVAFVAIVAIGSRGIPLPDTISQFLIGGGNLPMQLSLAPFVEALLITLIVSVIATLYPVRVATAITPLEAMNER